MKVDFIGLKHQKTDRIDHLDPNILVLVRNEANRSNFQLGLG